VEGKNKKGTDGKKQSRSGGGDCRALALGLEYGQFKKIGSP
jgi:hypothetical protein